MQVASQNSNAAGLVQLPCIVLFRCHFTDGIQAEIFDRFGRCHDEDTLCSIKGFKQQLEPLSVPSSPVKIDPYGSYSRIKSASFRRILWPSAKARAKDSSTNE